MTTTRPLPTDLGILRAHWLPPEPDNTTVTATLAGIHRIDQLVAQVVAQLAECDRLERAAIASLVDAAIAGDDLAAHVTPLAELDDRPTLEYRLDRLRTARRVAADRHDQARRVDVDYVAWQQDCAQLTAEWQYACGAGESPEARASALLDFAGSH